MSKQRDELILFQQKMKLLEDKLRDSVSEGAALKEQYTAQINECRNKDTALKEEQKTCAELRVTLHNEQERRASECEKLTHSLTEFKLQLERTQEEQV